MDPRTLRPVTTLRRGALPIAALLLAACSGSPVAPDALPADTTATVVEVDDGLTYLVTDDLAARIQQPGSAELDQLADAGVVLGAEVTELTITEDATGSRFVVVPPDGPEARLHLLVADTLHPVRVAPGDRGVVTELAEGDASLASHLTVAP
jgi:hypothetical protein